MEDKSDSDKIQSFIEAGNYHAAFNIAISALNECRRNNDQSCVDKYLGVIKAISLTMERAFGSKQ